MDKERISLMGTVRGLLEHGQDREVLDYKSKLKLKEALGDEEREWYARGYRDAYNLFHTEKERSFNERLSVARSLTDIEYDFLKEEMSNV